MADPKTGKVPPLAWILSIVALVIVWGLESSDTPVALWGVEVPGWLVAISLYILGFFIGRLAADAPLLRQRSGR